MSFPALAIAAAAATEVSRYTGVNPAFLDSLDIHVSHRDRIDGTPVFTVTATAVLFGYVHVMDGHPYGLHDVAWPPRHPSHPKVDA